MRSLPNCVSPTMPMQRDAEPEMRQHRAPGRARQAGGARNEVLSGTLHSAGAFGEIGERAGDHEHRNADRERRQHRPAPQDREQVPTMTTSATRGGGHQPLRHARQVAALPGQQRPERHRQQQDAGRAAPKVALKNGAPTEIFSPVSASSASG